MANKSSCESPIDPDLGYTVPLAARSLNMAVRTFKDKLVKTGLIEPCPTTGLIMGYEILRIAKGGVHCSDDDPTSESG